MVHICVCGVCMGMWCIYTHVVQNFFLLLLKTSSFHLKVAVFMKSGWILQFSYDDQLKSLKTAASTQITHFVLVFHRVQWEG